MGGTRPWKIRFWSKYRHSLVRRLKLNDENERVVKQRTNGTHGREEERSGEKRREERGEKKRREEEEKANKARKRQPKKKTKAQSKKTIPSHVNPQCQICDQEACREGSKTGVVDNFCCVCVLWLFGHEVNNVVFNHCL